MRIRPNWSAVQKLSDDKLTAIEAKQSYYLHEFQNAEGSPKKTWLIIHEGLIGENKMKNLPEEILLPKEKKIVKGKQNGVCVLNEHFVSIGHVTSLEVSNQSLPGSVYSTSMPLHRIALFS